jgi:DNA-binding MarR family transcriptional regulator
MYEELDPMSDPERPTATQPESGGDHRLAGAGAHLQPAALDAWRQLVQAHALVMREVERHLRAADLPPSGWYEALYALHEEPDRRLRHHELADRMLLSRSGLTRLVDRLDREGAIERRSVDEDRRGADVVLTDAGVRLMGEMWPIYAETLERHFARPLGVYAAGVRDGLGSVVGPLARSRHRS